MPRKLFPCSLLLLVVALFSAPQVRADGVANFVYTETISGDSFALVWQLPASPTPDAFLTGEGFVVATGVTSTLYENGISLGTNPDVFFFANSNASDQLAIIAGGFVSTATNLAGVNLTPGSQLYTGDESSPTFTPGTYSTADFFTGNEGTLVISTPEPSSLLLIVAGMAGLLALAALRKAAA